MKECKSIGESFGHIKMYLYACMNFMSLWNASNVNNQIKSSFTTTYLSLKFKMHYLKVGDKTLRIWSYNFIMV